MPQSNQVAFSPSEASTEQIYVDPEYARQATQAQREAKRQGFTVRKTRGRDTWAIVDFGRDPASWALAAAGVSRRSPYAPHRAVRHLSRSMHVPGQMTLAELQRWLEGDRDTTERFPLLPYNLPSPRFIGFFSSTGDQG